MRTAGPWKVIPATDGFRAPGEGDYAIVNDSLICPCTVWGWTEGAANAQLIAAAPELLEACRETVQSCHDLLEYAREALADHLLRYGETTLKNRYHANTIRADIASAEAFICKGEAAIQKAVTS